MADKPATGRAPMWKVIHSPHSGYWAVAKAVNGSWVIHADRFRSLDTARKSAERLNSRGK